MPASKPPRRPRQTARFLTLVLRQTLVHTLNLALYLFMALLVLVAGLFTFALTRDDIPVPGFIIRVIESRLNAAGIEVSFSRARLDLSGGVVIQDLRLEPSRFGEPVLEAGLVYLNFDELFLAAGMIELNEARIENVRLTCPAILSPSGSPFPIVRIAGASIERVGRSWIVRGLLAESGPLRLSIHGTITSPPGRPRAELPTPQELLDHFAALAPRIARAMGPLEELREPRLDLGFELGRTGEIEVSIEGGASSWSRTGVGQATDVRLTTQLTLSDGKVTPFEIVAGVATFTTADGVRVEGLTARGRWEGLGDLKRPLPSRITASAVRIVHPKAGIGPLVVELEPSGYPQIQGTLAVRVTHEDIEIKFAGDAAKRSGKVEARGRFASDWLAEASRVLGRDATHYATITQSPDFWGRAAIADGGKWEQAEFRALSGPIIARRVALDRARVHGVIVPERVDIDHLEIWQGELSALGTYFDVFTSRDRRLLLRGSILPLNISGWFSGWWTRFWDDFTFEGPAPTFDIDVAGNWNVKGSEVVQGRGTATKGTMRGIAYDSLDTRFFIRPNYYDLYETRVTRPEGDIAGEVQLQFRAGQRDAARTRFDFTSTADLVEIVRIFGPGGEALLAPYRYTVPPWARVAGEVTNDAGRFDTTLDIGIESTAEFRYHDFPVASISTDVKIHNSHVEIPRLVASYAGGILRASATATDGILDFNASLGDASYDDATKIFNDFLDRRSPPPPDERDPTGLSARPPGGRLNLGIKARGPITGFDAYEGSGSLRIIEANLGSVRIFGLLSDLLRTISPRLGSLSFTEANSTFSIQRDRVAFPDMRITGRTAALQTEGTYYLNSKNLDFKARLYPLGESGGAITQLFDLVLDPFSFLLEMRLTGTLRKPVWSLSRMPFAPKPVVDDGSAANATPAAAAPTAPGETPAPAPEPVPEAAREPAEHPPDEPIPTP